MLFNYRNCFLPGALSRSQKPLLWLVFVQNRRSKGVRELIEMTWFNYSPYRQKKDDYARPLH